MAWVLVPDEKADRVVPVAQGDVELPPRAHPDGDRDEFGDGMGGGPDVRGEPVGLQRGGDGGTTDERTADVTGEREAEDEPVAGAA